MYRGLSILLIAPVFNEHKKIVGVVTRTPRDVVDEVLVVDDGSSDGSGDAARNAGATVLRLERTLGVGAALRAGFSYAVQKNYDVAVVIAGNGKDSPEEVPKLLSPIAERGADFVQGSRYLDRKAGFGHMPLYRRFATRLHPFLFSLISGRRVTESTNGFRAIRRRVLQDRRIRLQDRWLDEYGLEPYLYLRTIRLGYRTCEVAVKKVYPPKHEGQTKMRPVIGWWSILRPLFHVAIGLK